jgi:hypothetical protein
MVEKIRFLDEPDSQNINTVIPRYAPPILRVDFDGLKFKLTSRQAAVSKNVQLEGQID